MSFGLRKAGLENEYFGPATTQVPEGLRARRENADVVKRQEGLRK